MSSLNSFSNLFPDQIHYHSLELNEKFSILLGVSPERDY